VSRKATPLNPNLQSKKETTSRCQQDFLKKLNRLFADKQERADCFFRCFNSYIQVIHCGAGAVSDLYSFGK
jgi:hypothetical protein